jgi:hypothetical protein
MEWDYAPGSSWPTKKLQIPLGLRIDPLINPSNTVRLRTNEQLLISMVRLACSGRSTETKILQFAQRTDPGVERVGVPLFASSLLSQD